MIARVERYSSTEWDTLGLLFIDGVWACHSLEDEYRATKVAGETRIPAGIYKVGLRHSPKFTPRYGHEMLHILDVPGFQYILIHPGNTEADTAGCLLVGNGVRMMEGIGGMSQLLESTRAYNRIYPLLASAAGSGDLSIHFMDRDRQEVSPR